MANARSTKPRGAVKPKAPPRPRVAPRDVLPEIDVEEDDAPDLSFNSFLGVDEDKKPKLPTGATWDMRWPFEYSPRFGDPETVFHSPESWNENIASARSGNEPLQFTRGILPLFSEEDIEIVRNADPRSRLYVEGDPKLAHDPLICDTCFPPTRWYSTTAYQRHNKRAHAGG